MSFTVNASPYCRAIHGHRRETEGGKGGTMHAVGLHVEQQTWG